MLKRNTMLLLNMKLQKKNYIPKYSKDWYRTKEPHTMNDPKNTNHLHSLQNHVLPSPVVSVLKKLSENTD